MLAKTPYSLSFNAPQATPQLVEADARRNAARIIDTLHEHHAELCAQLADYDTTHDEDLSPEATHKRLVLAAKFAAELLELATRADELAGSATNARQVTSMGALADRCFDVILRVDLARHDIQEAALGDLPQARKLAKSGLNAVRRDLARLEQRLASALAN